MKVCIDRILIKNTKAVVFGWVYSEDTIGIDSLNVASIHIKKHLRYDVLRRFKLSEASENCYGFTILIKYQNNNFPKLLFYSNNEEKIINVNKITSFLCYIKKKLNSGLLFYVLKPQTYQKVYYTFKNQGFKATYLKILNKIKNKNLDYDSWFCYAHKITDRDIEKQRSINFEYKPKISIITPTFNTPKKFLIEMIDSVREQTYSNWELCIADGNSNDETKNILKEYMKKDNRIKVKFLDKNLMISGNSNEAISIATGEYIGLFDHDDLLTPNCLFEIVSALNKYRKIDFLYTDEDKIDEKSNYYSGPHFKPDFSDFTLRSYNYITHFTVFSKELIKNEKDIFRSEFDGAQDYDLVLRLVERAEKIYHIPKILYHWRIHSNSTAGNSASKLYAYENGKKALEEYYKRNNIKYESVDFGLIMGVYKTRYLIVNSPLISIIIPNYEHKEDLEKCINSILNKSTYENYEIIIVENNSKSKEIFEFYKELEKNSKIKVIKLEIDEFNFSKICNYGAKFAKGEYLLLLNNDTEVITSNWLEEMLMLNQQENVGIVGAKLLYPDNTIQHAGVIVGMGGSAAHIYLNFNRNDFGHAGRLTLVQNLSAITGACMMIKRAVFDKIGGLDEDNFKVAFNDIDFCLRAIYAGYKVIWTPFAELYHHESKSRGYENTTSKRKRFYDETQKFKNIHNKYITNGDPFYNKNLTLDKADCSLRY